MAADRGARRPPRSHRAHARGLREAVRHIASRSAVAMVATAALVTALAWSVATVAQQPASGARAQGVARTLEVPVSVEGSGSGASTARPATADLEVRVGDSVATVNELS